MDSQLPKFVCCYSYKGGIGRSSTLSNWACWQALRAGKKVLIIDMDFEAPGQHKSGLFNRRAVEDMPIKGGLIDLCWDYQRHIQACQAEAKKAEEASKLDNQASEQSDAEQESTKSKSRSYIKAFKWSLSDYICRSSALDELPGTDKGEVFLLPATKVLDDAYTRKLHALNWDKFFSDYEGFDLIQSLRFYATIDDFDTVFVDARTGLSDPYYIATSWLCDTVVCFSHANRQSVEGCRLAMNFITRSDFTERYGAKRVFPVLNMLPPSRGGAVDDRKLDIQMKEWREVKGFVACIDYDEDLALVENLPALERANFAKSNFGEAVAALEQALEGEESYYYSPEEMEQRRTTDAPFENPFRDLRVEYWSAETIANRYASLYETVERELKAFQPSVVFGSRGTGKTTMARYLSYEAQLVKFRRESGRDPKPSDADFAAVGIWLRQDSDIVRAFCTDSAEQQPIYNRLFGMFFDILIARRVLSAMEILGGITAWLQQPVQVLTLLAQELGSERQVTSVAEFNGLLEQQLVAIRAYINNPDYENIPRRFQANVLIKLMMEGLRPELDNFFVVYLDEVENYTNFQQRVLNTRVKQVKNSDAITYKLLARNGGLKTDHTEVKGQNLEVTHDYRAFHLDENTDYEVFYQRAQEVVRRYLKEVPHFHNYREPEQLFAQLSLSDEAEAVAGERGNKPLLNYLTKRHKLKADHPLRRWLSQEPSLLRQAVAVVLVNQGKDAAEVARQFEANSATAQDWWHNYARGALFWLCTLYKKDKTYSGFNDIVGVAGNNIRVVVDLCFAICEAWREQTKANELLLPISPNTQSQAIHEQSDLYFQRLRDSNVDEDVQQRRLVERLGNLFAAIHKSPRQGEPEINHFSPKSSLDKNSEACLRACRQENLLRWLPSNKQKSSSDYLPDSYQLNPRYAPHFGISWRIKKKLDLSISDCKTLCSGDDKHWNAVHTRIERRYREGKKGAAASASLYR